MEPVNPLLPALRADTPALLRRAGSLISAVNSIQQEANAEYWYKQLQDEAFTVEQRKTVAARCSDLLRRDIDAALKSLENCIYEDELDAYGEGKYLKFNETWGGLYLNVEELYQWQEPLFNEIFSNQHKLARLQNNPAAQSQIMLDGAEAIRMNAPHEVYIKYISNAFEFDGQLSTLKKKMYGQNCGPYQMSALSEMIENFPGEPELYLARGKCREMSDKYPEALDDLNNYLSMIKTDASAFKLRGRIRNFLGDVVGMEEDATVARQLEAVLEKD